MTVITAAILRETGACEDEVEVFEEEWPEGAEVTLENLERAVALELSLPWAAVHLLSCEGLAEYERVMASAVAEYSRVMASAEVEYDRVRASAVDEYYRATAPAFWAGWQIDHPAEGADR